MLAHTILDELVEDKTNPLIGYDIQDGNEECVEIRFNVWDMVESPTAPGGFAYNKSGVIAQAGLHVASPNFLRNLENYNIHASPDQKARLHDHVETSTKRKRRRRTKAELEQDNAATQG